MNIELENKKKPVPYSEFSTQFFYLMNKKEQEIDSMYSERFMEIYGLDPSKIINFCRIHMILMYWTTASSSC